MGDEQPSTRRRVPLTDRLLGTGERLGLWTLPMFLIVGLAGAVLAGTIAVVWYSQQVTSLRDEIRDARDDLQGAVERVEVAGDEALTAIEDEVAAVQEVLTRNLPIERAEDVGLVLVRATVRDPAPPAAAAPQPDPSPTEASTPPASPETSPSPSQRRQSNARSEPAAEPEPAPQPSDSPADPEQESPAPAPAPAPAPTSSATTRLGSAFAVARDGAATFFVTAHAVVADAGSPGGVLETVEIILPSGPVIATVHAWDQGRDLALLRAEAGSVVIAPWRPVDDPLAQGERIVAAGLTSSGDLLRLSGTVVFSDVSLLVDDLDTPTTVIGGPVVDLEGRIVAIRSSAYAPLDGIIADVPVHLLCERLLRNCQDVQDGQSDAADEGAGG